MAHNSNTSDEIDLHMVSDVGCCCIDFTWNCVQFWTPLSVTFIVLWLLYSPNKFHPHVDSAILARLEFTNDSVLRYHLSSDLSFRNAQRHFGIWYLDVGATAFYRATKLGPTDDALPSFDQRHKNTTVLHATFRSAVAVEDPHAVVEQLSQEPTAGVLHLGVRVSLTLLYKVFFKSVVFYTYDCSLPFPLLPPRNATPAVFHGDGGRNCWRVD